MFFNVFLPGLLNFLNSAIFLFGYITGGQLFPEPLSKEEEKQVIENFERGDKDARNILIERNLRLVVHVCKKYINTNIEQDDLLSIGTIGLIKGINSFKPEKGSKLSTYVSRCIENEILMYLRWAKKLNQEVYLNEPRGKDKDDNVITLEEVLENDSRGIEEEVDLKMKIKKMYNKIKDVLKIRENNNRIKIWVKRSKTKNSKRNS